MAEQPNDPTRLGGYSILSTLVGGSLALALVFGIVSFSLGGVNRLPQLPLVFAALVALGGITSMAVLILRAVRRRRGSTTASSAPPGRLLLGWAFVRLALLGAVIWLAAVSGIAALVSMQRFGILLQATVLAMMSAGCLFITGGVIRNFNYLFRQRDHW